MNKRTAFMAALAAVGFLAVGSAQAVPWCHGGTILTVTNQNWDYGDLLNHTQNISVPPNVLNPDVYLAFHGAANYCQNFAGGGGAPWNNVPGSGTVVMIPYGPSSYGTQSYQLEQGLQFKCDKCYTIAPWPAEPVEFREP